MYKRLLECLQQLVNCICLCKLVYDWLSKKCECKTQEKEKNDNGQEKKEILTSLVYNKIKQKEGQSTEIWWAQGQQQNHPYFSTKMVLPCTNPNKSSYRAAVLKRYEENDFFFSKKESVENTAVLVDGTTQMKKGCTFFPF